MNREIFSQSFIIKVILPCQLYGNPIHLWEFWGFLKDDIMRYLREFHAHGILPRGTNSSFISLIAKCENPQGFGDFRSISLVNCLYKILAKLLANRMSKVLGEVIDLTQSAFLGRQLLGG